MNRDRNIPRSSEMCTARERYAGNAGLVSPAFELIFSSANPPVIDMKKSPCSDLLIVSEQKPLFLRFPHGYCCVSCTVDNGISQEIVKNPLNFVPIATN